MGTPLDLPIWVLSIGAKSGRDNVRLHGLFVASLLSGVDGGGQKSPGTSSALVRSIPKQVSN
jgi:hypothetical protein